MPYFGKRSQPACRIGSMNPMVRFAVLFRFLCLSAFRPGPAYRTIRFPQIQEANMPSFRAADALVKRLVTDRAFIHDKIIADFFRFQGPELTVSF
jgi:hypothetical protein